MRENLKQARTDKGMTQQAVAEYLGIKVRAYKYIESGKTHGKIETWDKLEDLFGVNQRILRKNLIDREDSR